MVLTGDVGTGKSMLVAHFLSRIDDSYKVFQIGQTLLTEAECLEMLLLDMGEPTPDQNVSGMFKQIISQLELIHNSGKHTIIVIDDAQNLSPETIIRLYELSQKKVDGKKICTLYLIGESELRKTLESQKIREYIPTINSRYHLGVLSLQDIRNYVLHRLAVAGGDKTIKLAKDIFPILETYTGGRPRLINVLVDHVLTFAYLSDITAITTKVVDAAIAELHWLPFGVNRTKDEASTDNASGEERRSSYKIIIQSNNKVKGEYFIRKKRITIGRHKENDLRIDDPLISRQHAQIIQQGRTTYFRDLNSTNGSFLNNKRIDIAPLEEGTIIQVGNYMLTYTRSTKNTPANTNANNVIEFAATLIK
jgi:type II secretory pathway predicted ATPase ExeA